MSGRDTKTTISNFPRMPRHQEEIDSEKRHKNLLLRAKTGAQLTCGTEKHRNIYIYFSPQLSGFRNEGAFYISKSQERGTKSVTRFTWTCISPVQ